MIVSLDLNSWRHLEFLAAILKCLGGSRVFKAWYKGGACEIWYLYDKINITCINLPHYEAKLDIPGLHHLLLVSSLLPTTYTSNSDLAYFWQDWHQIQQNVGPEVGVREEVGLEVRLGVGLEVGVGVGE